MGKSLGVRSPTSRAVKRGPPDILLGDDDASAAASATASASRCGAPGLPMRMESEEAKRLEAEGTVARLPRHAQVARHGLPDAVLAVGRAFGARRGARHAARHIKADAPGRDAGGRAAAGLKDNQTWGSRRTCDLEAPTARPSRPTPGGLLSDAQA